MSNYSEHSVKTHSVFMLWLLAKEIFKSESVHASMTSSLYENYLDSE